MIRCEGCEHQCERTCVHPNVTADGTRPVCLVRRGDFQPKFCPLDPDPLLASGGMLNREQAVEMHRAVDMMNADLRVILAAEALVDEAEHGLDPSWQAAGELVAAVKALREARQRGDNDG